MEEAFILGAYRSPVGRLLGGLSALSAPRLASIVISEGLKKTGLEPSVVDEVIMGNVISAGLGQNPARQAAMYAGLSETTAAFTVNKVCASGLKAVSLGAEAIMLGEADLIVAGGMESMSNAPHLIKDLRRGKKYGDSKAIDAMIFDGLLDCYNGAHMGELCEHTVNKYRITREEQDSFALDSHRKAAEAIRNGSFADEMIQIKTEGSLVSEDETIRKETSMEALSRLKPAFVENGTITAGNSPGLNDGAAIMILASGRKARALGMRPLARIVGSSSGHLEPKWYTIAPVVSVKNLLKKTGLKLEEFDLIEENEAFAAQAIAVMKELSLDPSKVNVNGGAIALGHPIGASGARVLATLVHALKARKKRLGLATLCLGGGGAMSMAIEAIEGL
ncbi:MAG: acetyl-CoA C-acetyltransferase [Deltaproteobacteria bacterium]|nr:acetyl-CoA C-acetyltransferase [Deltaproteobacteria bacterium]